MISGYPVKEVNYPLFVYIDGDNTHLFSQVNGSLVMPYFANKIKDSYGNIWFDGILADLRKLDIKKINEYIEKLIESEIIVSEYRKLIPRKTVSISETAVNVMNNPGFECIDEFIKHFQANKYFDHITNHSIRSVFAENCIYINCALILPMSENIERINIDSIINKNVISKCYPCFDWQKPIYNKNITSSRIDFYIRNLENPICMIFPEYKSVVLCDVSHNSNFEWFEPIWEKIIKILDISPKSFRPFVEITIGSDPEFEYLDKELHVQNASIEFQGPSRLKGKIGTDGCSSTMEIRSNACRNELEFVDDISKTFRKLRTCMMGVRGNRQALGAHIHFGLLKNGYSAKLPIDINFINLLDEYLGKKFINFSGKARGDYKRLKEYREQPHGIEYRSLPSAIFTDRKICKIIFKIAHRLAENFYIKKKEIVLKPDRSDYLELGLKNKEIDAIESFEKTYKRRKVNIIPYWTKQEKEKLINVKFIGNFTNDFKDRITVGIENTNVPFKTNIIFYNLSKQNKMAGISFSADYVTSHDIISELDEGICFGLSRSFSTIEHVNDLVQKIKIKLSLLFDIDKEDFVPTTKNLFPEEINFNNPVSRNELRDSTQRESPFFIPAPTVTYREE
jgi:hypothetical protein